MNKRQITDPSILGTVTVTYNPDLALLKAQLMSLPPDCPKILVDNASLDLLRPRVKAVAANVPNLQFLQNATNVGLATAINRGVQKLSSLSPMPRFALLLDQDSEPVPGSIATLVDAFINLEISGHKTGCVGPALRDPETGLTHGFHQCSRWRWYRVHPSPEAAPVQCANLNGSGTLVPTALFLELGGLDEVLFIDHVDTEWAFRVLASGRSLWGIPAAVFDHRMGQASTRFWWFGWHVWPLRSPIRHYFLFRNAVNLMRRAYVPRVWKIWAVAKLIITAGITLIVGPERRANLTQMWLGVCQHGLAQSTKRP